MNRPSCQTKGRLPFTNKRQQGANLRIGKYTHILKKTAKQKKEESKTANINRGEYIPAQKYCITGRSCCSMTPRLFRKRLQFLFCLISNGCRARGPGLLPEVPEERASRLRTPVQRTLKSTIAFVLERADPVIF